MEISDLGRKIDTFQTRDALHTSTNFLLVKQRKIIIKIEFLKFL